MPDPFASIVTVLDHKVGDRESWETLRRTLHHLASQGFSEPVEVILVESEDNRDTIPPDLTAILPDLRIVTAQGKSSFELKNAGAAAARADLVVILDADCRPAPGWWQAVRDHWQANPDAAIISGRTLYEGDSLLGRVFALIDRSYVDVGKAGPTGAISNNNAAFRRDVLLAHPFSNEVGPFGSEPHSDRIKAANLQLRFEPGMVAYHAFEGWPMVREERRHIGFSLTRYRQLHPEQARNGWMVGRPWLWMAYLVAASTYADIRRSFRHAADYGVRWFQIPLIWIFALRAHLMSLAGARHALSGGWVGGWNTYR